MRAINLSSKLRPSAYRSVTEMVFTSSQKVIKPFCFAQFIFLTWRRMSCLRQKVNDRGKIRQSPVVTDNGRQSFPVGPRCICDGSPTHQICANKNRIGAISTIPPENINQIVLLKYFASADDVRIKYFYRRQPPACLRS